MAWNVLSGVAVEKRVALVLGATGGIGGEVARQLVAAGWTVRALARRVDVEGPGAEGFHWIRGDAMNREDVVRAASGVGVIVHAVNPPGYKRWNELVLPMIDNTIVAARESGARIVLPGTVYNYGPEAFDSTLTEDAPQRPVTRKGAIRVEMERRLRAAANEGVRSLVVRAGDFFGPRMTGNSWFSQGLARAGRPVTSIVYPGRPGIAHQWAYLPDVARTMVRLLEVEDRLEAFATFHMRGHVDEDGTRMTAAIRRAAAEHGAAPVVRAFPWWAITLASPFVTLFREMLEMRYLWQLPVLMDNRRLVEVLGSEPHTPLDAAVRDSLAGLGCIPCDRSQVPAASAMT